MGRHYQILLPLLSIFLVRVDLTDLYPLVIPVEIQKVYDGDTVLVGRGSYRFKVRISRIDTPEKGQPFLNGKGDAGAFSRQCLTEILKQQKLWNLMPIKTDIYGRMLGELEGVSLSMVERGCSPLYPHAEFASKFEKSLYLQTLTKAKRLRKGLWKFSGIKQPKNWRKSNKRNAHQR